jgi:peptidoglycan/xylan/chitin deacetylase (PgdA/CDA1 family)
VTIEAVLHGSTEAVLGRAVGYADRWIVPARSRSSFEVVTRRPSGYDHSHLSVSSLLTSSAPFSSLSISAGAPSTDSAGVRHYPGRISNGSAGTAHLAQALVTTYDAYGRVQRVGWGITNPSSIAVGTSAPFDATVSSPVTANRVVYRAQASSIGCTTTPRYASTSRENILPPITRSTASRRVALTFDMGGRMDPAVAIVKLLVANHVCATIFPTGAISRTTEGQGALATINDHPELFELGNHTMHHCDLVRGGGGSPSSADAATCDSAGTSPSEAFVKKELTDGDYWIRYYSGMPTKPFWRAPYGSYDADVLTWAAEAGWTKHIAWDVDTIDWRPVSQGGPTAYSMAHKVVDNARSGSVVLMHLGGYETLDALHAMIDGLRERGYTLTTLSDILG